MYEKISDILCSVQGKEIVVFKTSLTVKVNTSTSLQNLSKEFSIALIILKKLKLGCIK